MEITVEYMETENIVNQLEIVDAKYLSDYLIRLKFNDGKEITVDFEPFLTASHHPSIRKYLQKTFFSKFEILDGNLNWNDYDLIFPIWDLYQGIIKQ